MRHASKHFSVQPSGPRALRPGTLRLAAALGAAIGVGACSYLRPPPPPPPPAPDVEVYRRADAERVERLEREVERLRADLREAEEALVAAESGLRGTHIRADAVSALAQARIEVDRAAEQAPWRRREVGEARTKLEEAERQLADGHIGSSIFFASRASRIARILLAEAERVRKTPGTRFVRARRVNLRAGPSTGTEVREVMREGLPVFPERREGEWILVRTVTGEVGWVHASLVREH